jgi:hypothetical protein
MCRELIHTHDSDLTRERAEYMTAGARYHAELAPHDCVETAAFEDLMVDVWRHVRMLCARERVLARSSRLDESERLLLDRHCQFAALAEHDSHRRCASLRSLGAAANSAKPAYKN